MESLHQKSGQDGTGSGFFERTNNNKC